MLQAKIPEPVENKRPDIVEYLDSLLSQYGTSVEKLRHAPIERAFVFDNFGNGIVQVDGDTEGVSFTYMEKVLLTGSDILIHNHPTEDWGISPMDIYTAIAQRIHRMIAISPKNIYILHLPLKIKQHLRIAFDESADKIEAGRYGSWENRGHLFTKIFADMIPDCRYEVVTL